MVASRFVWESSAIVARRPVTKKSGDLPRWMRRSLHDDVWLRNCSTGAGGFHQGNTCAGGGGGQAQESAPAAGAADPAVQAASQNLMASLTEALSKPASAVGGEFPKTTVIDTTKWPQHNGAAKWGAKKIASMEEMASKGDFDGLAKMDTFPKTANPNKYQKAVHEAHKKLLDQHGKALAKPPEAPVVKSAAVAASGSKTLVMDGSGWEKVGGQLGSNPGGQYKAPDGTKYYVKQPHDVDHAMAEVTAGKLYQLAGGAVPESNIVDINDVTGIASKWTDGEAFHPTNPNHLQAAQKDFAVHAWLANWDAVGLTNDNQKMVSPGNAVTHSMTVDVGGSLMYRAQGEKKAFGSEVTEWNSLRDASKNPQAASVFASMTPAQLQQSAQKLASIKDDDIRGIVKTYGPGTAAERNLLTERLIARRDNILNAAGLLSNTQTEQVAASPAMKASFASAAKKLKQHNTDIPQSVAPPKSTAPMAVPTPPIVVSKANPSAQAKLNEIFAAAQTGDVSKVEAVATNGTSKNTYSKKAHQYKQDVLAAMGSGGVASATQTSTHTAVGAKIAKVQKPIVIDAAKLPAKPEFVSKTTGEANSKIADQLLVHAKDGDLIALQGTAIPPSPKLQAFKDELVSSVAMQLNPPPPPKKISAGTLDEISKKAGVVKDSGKEKIGQWIVAANASGMSGVKSLAFGEGKSFDDSLWHAGAKSFEKLPENVQATVRGYTGGGYGSINQSLRTGAKASPTALRAANGVTEASIPIPAGTVLTRKHSFGADSDIGKLKGSVGKVVQDKGLMSTSSSNKWSGHVHWDLTVSEGVKGLPVRNFSNHSSEDEVILPPNTRVLITAVTTKSAHGSQFANVKAIILPFHEDQCCPP